MVCKDMEGSGIGPIKSLTWHVPGRTDGNCGTHQLR